MTWVDTGRRCDSCGCITYRPPRSPLPCPWCGEALRDETPEEAQARRAHYLAEAHKRGQE
jgi:uncharacterized Zn finger protein (UPF0148 family)